MPMPDVGQVVNGFVFQGGNPNSQASWKPATGNDLLPSLKPKERVEYQQSQNKARAAYMALTAERQTVYDAIDKALKNTDWYTAGPAGWLNWVPGSPPKTLASDLKTIKSNIGFDKLQQMRENSPTGGALGQVSDRENELLQSVMGNLDQDLAPSQLRDNLIAIRDRLRAGDKLRAEAYERDFGAPPPNMASVSGATPPSTFGMQRPAAPNSASPVPNDINALLKKYGG